MAQHDYDIANGTGAAVRTDINNVLDAVVSQNSGGSEPSTTFSYQNWADTSAGLLKIRNGANNAWVTVGTLDAANLGLAKLASPTFTGNPKSVTKATGDNDTSIATTAFVKTAVDNSFTANTPPSVQVFTSSGTYTKTSGMVGAKVTIIGGGGGGGAAAYSSQQGYVGAKGGGGGAAGGTVIKFYTAAQLSSSQSVTVGAGGAKATSVSVAGGTASSSTFKSLTASGGLGGSYPIFSGTNPVPTNATGGDLNLKGAANGFGNRYGNLGHDGANSSLGGGGRGGASCKGTDGSPNTGGGGGGGGSSTSSVQVGGDGADGICIIEEFF
tara:strand:+ start:242 stop:1219 length:978 start_codon:yes stop_codon:yes gene_type:complete